MKSEIDTLQKEKDLLLLMQERMEFFILYLSTRIRRNKNETEASTRRKTEECQYFISSWDC